ncbi:hypothetical protein [Streptomyces sp. NPDC088557]|uniref:hypothetical protein n=1 Tax=Streptomyces sp. NPDC088557 TaxID=3365867 RepID=UPI003813F379
MNRTRMVGRIVSAEECGPGEILIPLRFSHGPRERVTCAETGLLAGSAARNGWKATPREMHAQAFAEDSPGTRGPSADAPVRSTGWAVSYELGTGLRLGFAALADPADRAAVAAARRIVEEWTAALRTRLLVTTETGALCAGARGLLAAVQRAGRPPGGRTVVAGSEGCGLTVTDELRHLGARRTADGGPARPGDLMVVGPLPPSPADRAAPPGVTVVDAVCERHRSTADELARLTRQGEHVVLAAPLRTIAAQRLREGAEEAEGAEAGGAGGGDRWGEAGATADGRTGAGRASGGERARPGVALSAPDPAATPVPDPRRVGFALVPGQALRPALAVGETLRARFGHVVPQAPGTYCYEADDRRDTVRCVAALVDLLLIAARPDDPEAADVASWAPPGTPVRTVTSVRDLDPGWLRAAGAVGVVETVHAPRPLAEQLLYALRRLGPSDTVRRSVTTRRAGPGTPAPDSPDAAPGTPAPGPSANAPGALAPGPWANAPAASGGGPPSAFSIPPFSP